MQDLIMQPWSWYFSGVLISLIMFFLIYFGQTFGFSSNLRTICAASGLGKNIPFLNFDWKSQKWNLMFLLGSLIGGFITHQFLSLDIPINISSDTIQDLSKLGIGAPIGIQPEELFSLKALFTIKGFFILSIGGFLVGFGSRYAGGCTSGHAISGLSNLQLPSLIAVIGFFVGGLIMTFLLLPIILKL